MPWAWIALIAVLAALAWNRVFDIWGTLGAAALGLLVLFLLDPTYLAVLVIAMILTFGITRYGRAHKFSEPGPRTVKNLLANNVGTILAVALTGAGGDRLSIDVMFFSSLGFAIADTFGSEGGSIQGKAWMITNLKRVKPGTDGGISHLGEVATVLGSGLIFLIALLLRRYGLGLEELTLRQSVLCLFLAPVIGAHFDSFLGATLQRRGLMDNHMVNAASSLLTVLLAYSLL